MTTRDTPNEATSCWSGQVLSPNSIPLCIERRIFFNFVNSRKTPAYSSPTSFVHTPLALKSDSRVFIASTNTARFSKVRSSGVSLSRDCNATSVWLNASLEEHSNKMLT